MRDPTEPDLTTAPELQAVLQELRRREPIFHRPEFGTSRADYEQMMDVDFWEVGASGRRYSRACVLDVLDARRELPGSDPWETSGFHCARLAPDTYLLTYTLLQGRRLTRRATIWRRTAAGDWSILYHQGTEVTGD